VSTNTNKRTLAPFDDSLPGKPVISVDEATRRNAFLRTDTGKARAFKVTRRGTVVIVKAFSVPDALAFANQYVEGS
jgi:hypothetical protein